MAGWKDRLGKVFKSNWTVLTPPTFLFCLLTRLWSPAASVLSDEHQWHFCPAFPSGCQFLWKVLSELSWQGSIERLCPCLPAERTAVGLRQGQAAFARRSLRLYSWFWRLRHSESDSSGKISYLSSVTDIGWLRATCLRGHLDALGPGLEPML